jgi:putative tryptophan/tyrosine transport system substrate-binding protein
MHNTFRIRFGFSLSDNLKSKIENLKWLGLSVIAFVLVVSGAVAQAQQPKKIPRIAFLSTTDRATDFTRFDSIRQHLRELGYIEGQNIAFEYRSAGGKLDRYQELAAELVRLGVDILVVGGGTVYVQVAKNATNSIPIVMTGPGADPVEAGLVKSLAQPGGNITGVTNLGRDLGGKRLELLKEAVPKLTRIAVIYDPDNPSHVHEVKDLLPAAARALSLTLQPWEVRASGGFENVFAAISKQLPDGLYVPGGPVFITSAKRIAGFAVKNRLPSTYGNRGSIDAGGLMYYGADLADSYRQVATYVDRILKGARPGDLPVEQPTKFELMINLKTAKQIGLTIPPNVLARADRVIR